MSDVLLCLAAGLAIIPGLAVIASSRRRDWIDFWGEARKLEPHALVMLALLLAALFAASAFMARAVGAEGWPCSSDDQCADGEGCVDAPGAGVCRRRPTASNTANCQSFADGADLLVDCTDYQEARCPDGMVAVVARGGDRGRTFLLCRVPTPGTRVEY